LFGKKTQSANSSGRFFAKQAGLSALSFFKNWRIRNTVERQFLKKGYRLYP
jgi:hypothetical protein